MGKKLRVLLADDEPHIRLLIRSIVEIMNAEVVGEAADGQEAVDLYSSLKPDMVLLDINMPVKSGQEALKMIMTGHSDAIVIMLTSVSDKNTVKQCIELGAANYIRKDTSISEIKKIIKETWELQKKRLRRK